MNDPEFDWAVKEIREGKDNWQKLFDFFDKEFRERLGRPDGYDLYSQLFSMVESAGDQEAKKAFQDRFVPMLDEKLLRKNLFSLFEDAVAKEAKKKK